MKTIMIVGLGSFAGGVARHLITEAVQRRYAHAFPSGTLCVNIIGCFLIGIILGLSGKGVLNTAWTPLLTTGFLGGFTTFSAFSHQTVTLLRGGEPGYALAYVGVSVVGGLMATYAAMLAVR